MTGLALVLAAAAVVVAPGRPRPMQRLRRLGPSARPPLSVRASLRRLAGWSARSRWAAPVVGLLAAGSGVVAAGPALGVCLGVLGWAMVRAASGALRRGADGRETAALLDAVEALAAELRAGRTPAGAIAAAAGTVPRTGVGKVLSAAASVATFGGDPSIALADAAGLPESPGPAVLAGLHRLAAAWRVSASSGSGLADVVETVERDLLADAAHRRGIQAELAGPRATSYLLAGLPLAGIGLGTSLGAAPVHVLLDTTIGQAALLIGVGLDAVGLWWTGRIVRSADR